MKIAFITPAYYPAVEWGGPIVSVHLLAKELVRLGHKVQVYTTAFGLPENQNQKTDKDGVGITYFKFFAVRRRWFISWPLLAAVVKKRREFDVIHVHVAWDPVCWMSAFVLSFLTVKIIFSPRGEIERALINKKSRLLKVSVYYLFLRRVFRKAYGLHFTSEHEKQQFNEYTKLAPRSAVILNPFESEMFATPVSKSLLSQLELADKRYYLYLGRVDWKKRPGTLIRAFALFSKNHSGFSLAILGTGEAGYIRHLKETAQSAGIEQQCIIPGDLVYGDLRLAAFQNAYAFVLPSYSENFGFVAVEALASNVPLIISDGVGIKELLLQYGAALVFRGSGVSDNEAVENLAREMEMACDKQTRNDLIKNGALLLAREFNNVQIAQKMLELYL